MRPILAMPAVIALLTASDSSPTPLQATPTPCPATGARLGTFDITSGAGALFGSVVVEAVDEDAVRVTVQIGDQVGLHAWGIYEIGRGQFPAWRP